MISEWLKVMLDEIARKQAEAVQAREEEARRSEQRRSEQRRAEEHQAGRSAPSVVVQSGEFDPRKKNGDAA